ncbi:ATP-binding cassette domain-containing protein [Bacteroides sp. 519]|uniref:ABC transporter ATP-binding protein n=1 Tax=Bacteroides sp. 519 TaxID=2302937 RepID=UPI0013D7BD39|nr:ABC transporter ATP-binding protein [Bacteroides sp. 519]NDV57836.1 ABC transporter ATP-binding protein [Bacteroides sp. 519]
MITFNSMFDEVRKLVALEEFSLLTKRVIDLTLDTGNLDFYKETVSLLDWLDNNNSVETQKNKFTEILDKLYQELQKKSIVKREESLLTVENLIRSYEKSNFALGPISFEISEGQIIGLVGENGNGKTTLLRSLCGELQPTSGKINYAFPYKDNYDLRSKLIYIPQRTNSWQGSLLSNLRFTAASYGITGEENILVTELITARMGLRKFRTYKWKDLSSGYKMRFELARALLRNPRLLLIDEPLANLDILAQQIVLDDFRDIAQSLYRPIAVVLSSQQLYEVEKTSDKVIFLKNGSPQNVIEDSDVACSNVRKLIIEFDSEWKIEQLKEYFSALGLEKLQMNGGTYIAIFPETVTQNDFQQYILEQNIPISYFRNISNSTRRFFLS